MVQGLKGYMADTHRQSLAILQNTGANFPEKFSFLGVINLVHRSVTQGSSNLTFPNLFWWQGKIQKYETLDMLRRQR